jgi:hypothetical protein
MFNVCKALHEILLSTILPRSLPRLRLVLQQHRSITIDATRRQLNVIPW